MTDRLLYTEKAPGTIINILWMWVSETAVYVDKVFDKLPGTVYGWCLCSLHVVLFKQPLTSSQQMGKSLAIRFEEQLLSVFTKSCTWSACWQIVNGMGNVWCLLNATYVKHCRSQPGVNLKCCMFCPAQAEGCNSCLRGAQICGERTGAIWNNSPGHFVTRTQSTSSKSTFQKSIILIGVKIAPQVHNSH